MPRKTDKLVAYIGCYSSDNNAGLFVYDVDSEGELLKIKQELPANNPSHILLSKDKKLLYSIVDEGVAAFLIEDDGKLKYLNTKPTGGMRGCYMDIDSKRRYIFVAGFHDGRVSMLKIKKDGSLSGLADGVFHRGHAISANERRLDHPKVSGVCLTPDEQFICATDYGLNQMKIYRLDYDKGLMSLEDTVRCAMDSAPRTVCFSGDGKYCYILTESANAIEVYEYSYVNDKVDFELVQRIPVMESTYVAAAATHMFITDDDKYVFVSVDGMNYVSWLKRNVKDGKLSYSGKSPVSGDYPKHIKFIPDSDELVVLNHDSGEVRDFKVNLKEGYMLLCKKPAKVERANCIRFKRI